DALQLRPGPDGTVRLDATRAGWRYLSFETIALAADRPRELGDPRREEAVVILGGGGLAITFDDDRRVRLPGRSSPFDALPWAIYLPPGRTARATAEPAEAGGTLQLAVATAPVGGQPSAAIDPLVIGPDDVTVELR